MPTLNSPQTAAYTTATPGEFVSVVCTGATDVMLVTWTGPAGTSGRRMVQNTTSAGEEVGPFLNSTVVTFSALSGSPTYTAPAFADPLQSLVSGAGNARVAPNALEFKSTDGWTTIFGGTQSYSTAGAFRATQTMTYTPGSASDGIKRTLATPITIPSGAIIEVAFTLPESIADQATPANLALKLSSDGNVAKALVFTALANKFRAGGQQVVTFKAGEDGATDYDGTAWVQTGTEAWGNAFNYIHLLFGNLSGIPIQIDSITIGPKSGPRVVWTFDNLNDTSALSVIAPALAQYGWSAALMMDSDLIAANIATINSLRGTYNWEIGSMGGPGHINYNTTPGGGSAAQLTADLPLVFAAHSAAGLPRPTSFAYPSNQHNAACDALLAANGFTWRRSRGDDILPNGGGNAIPRALGSLVRSGYSQPLAANSAAIKNRIDALIQRGGVLSLFTHLFSTDSTKFGLGVDLAHGLEIIDYLGQMKRNYGLECVRPSDVTSTINSIRRF
jgi:hypothetical protein